MIRQKLAVVGVLATFFSMAAPAVAQEPMKNDASGNTRYFNFIVGQKMLDDKDWNKNFKAAGLPDLHSQTSFGLEMTYGPKRWPVNIATDILYSTGSGKSTALNRTVTGNTLEFGVGGRKVFALSMPLHPYVGLGVAYGSGAVTCSGCSSKSPTGVGFWANGGAYYSLSKLNLGAGLRYSSIDGKDGNIKLKVGGINPSLVIGYGF